MVDCVLVRHLAADEWDINLRNSITTRMHQIVDDGSSVLREGQQEDKWQQLADQSVGSIKVKREIVTR